MRATHSFDIILDGVDSTVPSSGEGRRRPIEKRDTGTLCSRGFMAVCGVASNCIQDQALGLQIIQAIEAALQSCTGAGLPSE